MALARTRRGENGMNYWPGFVDALSTLILSIIFLLSIFVVVQFYLQQEVQGQNTALQRLNVQIGQLSNLLSMEKTGNADLKNQLAQLQASLATTQSDRDKYQGLYQGAASAVAAAQSKIDELSGQIQTQKDVSAKALAQVDTLNSQIAGQKDVATKALAQVDTLNTQIEGQKDISAKALAQVDTLNQQIAALRQQLTALSSALDISEKKGQASEQRITDLGQRLNVALAQHVQELSSYRSDFFGKLRQILGNRPDMRIVGDRFVLQSEIFFDTGRADLKPEGSTELDKVAAAVVALESQIPPDIPWVLRVDGHTDVRPITGQYRSNWDLSAARAIAVVKYLIAEGVQPNRLVAAGFGEFQPIDTGTTEDAYRRNRRIEFKLTER
ncbi:MAG: peptidoglycan -binding protein [Xanthobacteraceae bacterium]